MPLKRILFLVIVLIPGFKLFCQQDSVLINKKPLVINELVLPLTFDGIPDEEAWNSVKPLKMTMYSPVFGKDPTEHTDVRIAYDDKYLYAGAWIYYQDPSMMRSSSLKRDYKGMGSDWFGLFLDTYNDKENSMMFFTTPDGLRFDAGIQKDAVRPRPDQEPMNLSWNAFWDVLTRKDSAGWSAEFRIPLSSLRFQEVNGEVRMGLTVERWIPSKNEIHIFPAIPPNWGETSIMKPSQAQEILFRE
ncbi:MAG: carbohydrate binding family 9 domain-containing protein, partial [Bacteroidales bacterium]|nr:carbohydrate binding family 9 domain-containing protein [Bacteroidales bacterium]